MEQLLRQSIGVFLCGAWRAVTENPVKSKDPEKHNVFRVKQDADGMSLSGQLTATCSLSHS